MQQQQTSDAHQVQRSNQVINISTWWCLGRASSNTAYNLLDSNAWTKQSMGRELRVGRRGSKSQRQTTHAAPNTLPHQSSLTMVNAQRRKYAKLLSHYSSKAHFSFIQ